MPAPEDVPAPILPLSPVRGAEVEEQVETGAETPVAEPLFTVKVWQLGFAVIAIMLALLYSLGIL